MPVHGNYIYSYCDNNPIGGFDPGGFVNEDMDGLDKVDFVTMHMDVYGGGGSRFSYHYRVDLNYYGASNSSSLGGGIYANGYLAYGYESPLLGQSNACFLAGNLIKTQDGSVTTEDITVGACVYVHDPDTGENRLKQVVRIFVKASEERSILR